MFYTIQDPIGRSVGRIEILDVHTNELLKDFPLQLTGIFLNKNLMGYLLSPVGYLLSPVPAHVRHELPTMDTGVNDATENQSSSQTG